MSDALCPSAESLRAFAVGELPETEIDELVVHLASCPVCEAGLTQLDHLSDPLILNLRLRVPASIGETMVAEPPTLTGLSARLDADAPIPEHLGGLRLIREIGRGGMGIVYEAFEGSLNRHVAIKLLPGRGDIARFRREARAAGRLHHTNIVPIFGIGEYQGHHYYVMQYIAGCGLDAVLEERRLARGSDAVGEREVLEAARIGVQMAEALAYAHAQGVIHRDVKPSNILLDRAGTVWVTDFGLASDTSDTESLTHTGDFLGTLRYVAPERIDGRGDSRADQYGLGVCLYELACGRPAFGESDHAKLVNQVLHQDPPRPREVNPRVPPDLETIILKAMDRDPDRRYVGAAALAADLHRFLGGQPIQARRTSPGERLMRWSRRNPWLAAAVGSIAAALLTIAVLGLLYANQKSRIAEQQTRIARHEATARGQIGLLNLEMAKRGEELERSLAKANLNLAMFHFERGESACERGEIAPGLLHLIECWRSAIAAGPSGMPWRRSARESLSLWERWLPTLEMVFSHEERLSSVAFSPDGRTVVTGSHDHTARLWDSASGRPKGVPLRHNKVVNHVGFAGDGRTVLTASADGTVRFWDVDTGQEKAPPFRVVASPIVQVAVSPIGDLAAAGCNSVCHIWDLRSGSLVGKPLVEHTRIIGSMAFSPNGKTLVTGTWANTVRFWDLSSFTPSGGLPDHPESVDTVAFHPDGKVLATGCRDRQVRFWSFPAGELLGTTLTHDGGVRSIQFSRDGKSLLSASLDGTAQVWDVASRRRIGPRLRHRAPLEGAAFGPDDLTVVTACVDGSARLWNRLPSEHPPTVLRHASGVKSVAFSPDGKTVLTGSLDGSARLWNLGTGEPVGSPLSLNGQVMKVAFHPRGPWVAATDGDVGVQIWDPVSGTMGVRLPRSKQAYVSVAFGPDGGTLVTGNWSGAVRFWDVATGQPRGPAIDQAAVYAVALSADGRLVATGSYDGTARLYDAATGAEVGPPLKHKDGVLSVAFSPDGQTLLTGCVDSCARLWDCASHRVAGPVMRHQGRVWAVAFRPDGQAVLTGSDDQTARIWDAATGRPIGPVLAHEGAVLGVAFRPDGRFAITGSADATARIWDVSIDMPDDSEEAARRVEVRTGLTLNERAELDALDAAAWHERRDKPREAARVHPH